MKPEDEPLDRGDRLRELHARAQRTLDERPAPRVRATVLAAAARAAVAKPHAASDRLADSLFAQRRWPWSIAAVLVVAAAAGLVATHAARDDPAPVLVAREDAPISPPLRALRDVPAVSHDPAAGGNAPMPAPASSQPPVRQKQRRAASLAAAGREAPPVVEPAQIATVEPAARDPVAAQASMPPATEPFPAQHPLVATASLATPPASPVSPRVSMPVPSAALRVDAADALARPADEAARVAPHGRVGIEPASPEAWVARIVALRAAGDDDAADHEVQALRRRYPAFRIPAEAARNAMAP